VGFGRTGLKRGKLGCKRLITGPWTGSRASTASTAAIVVKATCSSRSLIRMGTSFRLETRFHFTSPSFVDHQEKEGTYWNFASFSLAFGSSGLVVASEEWLGFALVSQHQFQFHFELFFLFGPGRFRLNLQHSRSGSLYRNFNTALLWTSCLISFLKIISQIFSPNLG
jgi:hypothetical protein